MRAQAPIWPRPGDQLALAAPAGAVDQDKLKTGLKLLAGLAPQLELRVDQAVWGRDGYFSGGDAQRARHLNELIGSDRVAAVWAARGGFGTSRILPLLDLEAMVRSRKMLAGFSDLTCLLNPLAVRGLVCVHGPTVIQLPRLDRDSQADVASLLKGDAPWPIRLEGGAVAPGRASGPLLGGNLTMLCHLLGTPYEVPLDGAILFLEDVGEAPYRLDRLLTQLELAGQLNKPAGFALGGFGQAQGGEDGAVLETLRGRLAPLGKPVVEGLPFGHGGQNRCLPVGALAKLDGDRGRLTVGVDLG